MPVANRCAEGLHFRAEGGVTEFAALPCQMRSNGARVESTCSVLEAINAVGCAAWWERGVARDVVDAVMLDSLCSEVG
jgi:hypothetical protein